MSSTSGHHRKPPPPQLLLVFLVHVFLGIQLSYSLTTYSSNQTSLPVRCRPDQASALLRLKSSFSTDGWGPFDREDVCTALASWQADTDCCGWEGIHCGHHADGRVTTLDLGHCGLESGTLHPALFDLTSLRHLDLSWNSFNGSQLRADGFERLTELVHLNLSSCGFDGQIPHAIGQLTKLVTLDLSTEMYLFEEYDDVLSLASWSREWQLYNELYGRIPESFADLHSLSVLRLTYNFLDGWLPSRIFQNKNLTAIDVRYNFKLSGSLPNFSSDSIIVDLLVTGTNFSGPVPSSISNLRSLNNLGIASTYFSQELPSSIGELRSLSSLQVSGTGMVGAIPSWIANLTSLIELQFSDCSLSGEVPSSIGNLKNLYSLKLYNSNFSGTLPPQMFNLTQLELLYLDSNNFHGIVELSSFLKIPQLFGLSLSNNKFTVVVDDDGNSSVTNRLHALRLAACNISKLPSVLRHLHSVQYLDLSNNQIHGTIPHWAWETWKSLVVLNLSHNKFNSIGYDSINPIDIDVIVLSFNLFQGPIPIPGPSTEVLDCSNNKFSSIPLNFGSHFVSFNYFNAYANNLSGNIPPSICGGGTWTMDLIDLSYNNLSGSIPSCLMEGTSVTLLKLKRNRLQGELPNNMNQDCSFEALDLSYNQIKGKLPRSLVSCRGLEVFDIGNNHINDIFPCWLSVLPELQVLVLKANKFAGEVGPYTAGEKNNCEFIKLRILDLASNKFSGTLQDEWFMTMKSMVSISVNESLDNHVSQLGQTYQFTDAITYKGNEEVTISKTLSTLVHIDVSDNLFHGAISKSIGDLGLLNGVNMSHNAFTGPIPPQFGALNQLESLDLSSNNLSGEIPQGLASLNFLSMLNLSYNELVGRIPDSPHFLTFTNLSFLGNIGLCGFQVSRACNNTTPYVEPHHSETKSVDLVLFLFTGLGFGVGFAIAVVLTCGIHVRRRSQNHIFLCCKKVLFFM
ncbi:unnamed protein product [Miscanthus lutarioriparius]|uniref:Leucine-rich repeat-containing N-terminal plant-type domain-containing protein n=1 Tax=Miscanthus lutarioriparius TaxID=422564 RepID=A0A811SFW5_9POAL|nr:unnamed protein product [Miscanthus lutarioriparius]